MFAFLVEIAIQDVLQDAIAPEIIIVRKTYVMARVPMEPDAAAEAERVVVVWMQKNAWIALSYLAAQENVQEPLVANASRMDLAEQSQILV